MTARIVSMLFVLAGALPQSPRDLLRTLERGTPIGERTLGSRLRYSANAFRDIARLKGSRSTYPTHLTYQTYSYRSATIGSMRVARSAGR